MTRLTPLWELFSKYQGSLRVVTAAATIIGLVQAPALPLPMKPLDNGDMKVLSDLINRPQLE